MNWQRIAIFLLPVGMLIAVLMSGFGKNPHALPDVVVGKLAPDINLTTLEGKPFRLSDYRGKAVVVNFWATFCEPCRAEHIALQRTAQSFGDRAQFVGVIYQEDPDVTARFLKRTLNTYPQVIDPDSDRAIAYGVSGVPETFIIAPDGTVVRRVIARVNAPLLRSEINRVLGAVP